MSWLIENQCSQAELAQAFLRLVDSSSILKIPGVHDGMAARVARKTGFEALYLSGAAYSASRG